MNEQLLLTDPPLVTKYSMEIMNPAIENLGIFMKELPDSQILLFLQEHGTPNTFHKFKHLPAELRQKIFKLTFPKRKVILKKKRFVPAKMKGTSYVRIGSRNPMPTTFKINKETRPISLITYKMLLKDPTIGPRGPLYFNSELDTLFHPGSGFLGVDSATFDYICAAFPKFAGGLDYVKALDCPIDTWQLVWEFFFEKDSRHECCEEAIFSHFKGLRSLTIQHHLGYTTKDGYKINEICMGKLSAWYEKRKEEQEDFMVPEISFKFVD